MKVGVNLFAMVSLFGPWYLCCFVKASVDQGEVRQPIVCSLCARSAVWGTCRSRTSVL